MTAADTTPAYHDATSGSPNAAGPATGPAAVCSRPGPPPTRWFRGRLGGAVHRCFLAQGGAGELAGQRGRSRVLRGGSA